MKILLFMGPVFLAAIAIVPQASAVDVVVGKTPIKLAAPQGFCPLDNKHPMDRQVTVAMQQAVQKSNEQLAVFANCDRLIAWRDGKADDLGDTVDYQVQLKSKTKNVSAKKMIPAVCALLRKQGVAIVKTAEKKIAKSFRISNCLPES